MSDDLNLERLADLIAERVIAKLSHPHAGSVIDAAEVARRFGVTRSWCYEHADELGAIRIGPGSRPRLRFNPSTVELRLAQLRELPAPTPITKPRPRRKDASHTVAGAPLLKVKDAA